METMKVERKKTFRRWLKVKILQGVKILREGNNLKVKCCVILAVFDFC